MQSQGYGVGWCPASIILAPALRYNRLDKLDGVYDDHLAIAGREEPIQRSGGGRSYRGTTGSYSQGQAGSW